MIYTHLSFQNTTQPHRDKTPCCRGRCRGKVAPVIWTNDCDDHNDPQSQYNEQWKVTNRLQLVTPYNPRSLLHHGWDSKPSQHLWHVLKLLDTVGRNDEKAKTYADMEVLRYGYANVCIYIYILKRCLIERKIDR